MDEREINVSNQSTPTKRDNELTDIQLKELMSQGLVKLDYITLTNLIMDVKYSQVSLTEVFRVLHNVLLNAMKVGITYGSNVKFNNR